MGFCRLRITFLMLLFVLFFLASCSYVDSSQVKESETLAFTNFDASDYFPRPGTLKEFEHAQSNGGVKSKEAVSNHIDGIALKSGEFVIHNISSIGDVVNESTIFYRVSEDEILNFHTDTTFMGELEGERLQLANKPNWTIETDIEATITAMNVTVKTPAGIFENCIEVSIMAIDIPTKKYYAPNIGLVSSAIEIEGEFLTTDELTYLHIPKIALENVKSPKETVNSPSENIEDKNNLSLINAASAGELESVINMIQEGHDPNTTEEPGYTALMAASSEGHAEIVKFLLESGANADAKDGFEKTVLMYATENGDVDTVKFLLKAGVNPHYENQYGNTAMSWATSRGNIDIVNLLKEEGINSNKEKVPNESNTTLVEAIWQNNLSLVKSLLQDKADPNSEQDGTNAIISAVYTDNIELVRILLEAGADPNKKDSNDSTSALQIAVERTEILNSSEIVDLLLDAGAIE